MDENTNVTGGAETGVENATDTSNAQGQETQNTGENTPKTYTAEELQAETDRRVGLTMDMIKMCVINDRAGLYDKK